MEWVGIALVTALSLSTTDALSKRALADADDITIAWVRLGYALPFLSISLLFIPIPSLDATFWTSVAALMPLEVIAIFLYIKAIRVSPLSLTVPFLALTPVFVVLTAFFMLGELPTVPGFIGILLIASGAYTLNAGEYRNGALGPLRAILKERGSVYMIIVALIYSVTSTLGKLAMQHSSPLFFAFFYPLLLLAPLTLIAAVKGRLGAIFARPARFFAIGICNAVMISTHYLAINLTHVAYMISVKRMSLVFSVAYGRLFFGEKDAGERLLGSLLMVFGAALIILF